MAKHHPSLTHELKSTLILKLLHHQTAALVQGRTGKKTAEKLQAELAAQKCWRCSPGAAELT